MNPGISLEITFRTEIQETDANPRRPQELQNDRHHVLIRVSENEAESLEIWG